MRRLVVRVSIVVLCSLLTFGHPPQATAQEATPVTEILLEGATI